MRHLRSLRPWFGGLAVLVGVVIGVLTNLATATPSLPVVLGLAVAVTVLVGLTVGQARRDERDKLTPLKEDRDTVLRPLRPDLLGAHTISTLLAAEHAVAPFRGRNTETQALTGWCLDVAAPAVHVLAGPGGWGRAVSRWRSPGSSRRSG